MIKKLALTIASMAVFLLTTATFPLLAATNVAYAAPNCSAGRSFFGLPSWDKYLTKSEFTDPDTGETSCTPQISGLSDTWKIVAAVIEILLRLATLAAIAFIVYGGVLYLISEGSPDKTQAAQKTIINAVIGLVISIISATVVGFIAGRF